MARSGNPGVGHDHGCGARTQSQRSECCAKPFFIHVLVQQTIDDRLRERAAGFTIDDQRIFHLAALYHSRSDVHSVHKAQAGVADIEVHTICRQPEISMDNAGR